MISRLGSLLILFLASLGISCGGAPSSRDRQHVGQFEITGKDIVITDPGYDLATASRPGLGVTYNDWTPGTWNLEVAFTKHADPALSEPKEMVAYLDTISAADFSSLTWTVHPDDIGGDYAMIGIYDLAHFGDNSVIPKDITWTFDGAPADPSSLWYSMNCELVGRKGFGAYVVPFGGVLSWDGGVVVSIGRDSSGSIVAVRFRVI
ncbi:hypothetical protein VSU19_00200 [Verrucomicrobiales bacterium BCK34]|nr:hypothetical protein [Verrucomicrobiales bacterium BCK34]